jgi:DNA-binding NarL/FixJ family response regulator
MKILIVDDHEIVRQGMRTILESQRDFEVFEAHDGEEAVEKAKELQPDLVILDISMPRLDGFSAAPRIKQQSPPTPIVIFSLDRTEMFIEVARKSGASGYITKGESAQTLLKAVDAVRHNQTYFPT